jgi:hypothetical protein
MTPLRFSAAVRTIRIPNMALRFFAAVRMIRSGDLLLFRRRGLMGWLIAAAGRSIYCHAGMAVWRTCCGHRLLCCAQMLARGGSVDALGPLVEDNPGRIDWFEANPENRWPEFDRVRAGAAASGLAGRSYGYGALLAATLRHAAVVRLFLRPPTDDRLRDDRPPMCSQMVAMACRGGGVDPIPELSDRATEPADLARSQFFAYRATLVP